MVSHGLQAKVLGLIELSWSMLVLGNTTEMIPSPVERTSYEAYHLGVHVCFSDASRDRSSWSYVKTWVEFSERAMV